MNEMNNRDYNDRYYDENMHGNRESYRDDYRYDYRYDNRADYRNDYRTNYRDDYREDYRTRDYDRRGGKINNRNYRSQDYYGELQMVMEDMREQYRKIEDVSEMAHNMQDKNMLMKIAQKEKENYNYIKQLMEK
nr:MAG TPA: hypothetical protein [Caudoviricetes sp.]